MTTKVDPLSFYCPDISTLLSTDDCQSYLIKWGAITLAEYEELKGLTPRKARQRAVEFFRAKPNGFDLLVNALTENIQSEDHHIGHEELLHIIRGPEYEFEKIISLFTTTLLEKDKAKCLKEMLDFFCSVEISQGLRMFHFSLFQGTADWISLLDSLRANKLVHCYDTDLLKKAVEFCRLDFIVGPLEKFRKQSFYVQDARDFVIPISGSFLISVHLNEDHCGPLLSPLIVGIKGLLSKIVKMELHHFQYIGNIQKSLLFQVPLYYSHTWMNVATQIDQMEVLKTSDVSKIIIRTDTQKIECNLKDGVEHQTLSSYSCSYKQEQLDPSHSPSTSRTGRMDKENKINSLTITRGGPTAISERHLEAKKLCKVKNRISVQEGPEEFDARFRSRERKTNSWSPGGLTRTFLKKIYALNFILLGPKNSGKTSLLRCYAGGSIADEENDGVTTNQKVINWNNFSNIKIIIWECARKSIKSMKAIIDEADGFVFVTDLTQFDDSLAEAVSIQREVVPLHLLKRGKAPMVLVVNKCDGKGPSREQKDFLTRFSTEHKLLKWFEVSAKLQVGIQDCFDYLALAILNCDAQNIKVTTK